MGNTIETRINNRKAGVFMKTRIVTEDLVYTIDKEPRDFLTEFLDEENNIKKDFVEITTERERDIFINVRHIIRVETVTR